MKRFALLALPALLLLALASDANAFHRRNLIVVNNFNTGAGLNQGAFVGHNVSNFGFTTNAALATGLYAGNLGFTAGRVVTVPQFDAFGNFLGFRTVIVH